MLLIDCFNFDCWFPAESKQENKLHCLTYHIPEKANLRGTVGRESENSSSKIIHPVVNKVSRTYANVQNVQKCLELIRKSQWLKG